MSLIPINQRETLLEILRQRNGILDYLFDRDGVTWVKLDAVAQALIPAHFDINHTAATPDK